MPDPKDPPPSAENKKDQKPSNQWEEEERIKKIREGKELKRNYISSISAKFNPDMLIG